jgi:hypothetical protein
MHHWADVGRGLDEMARVARRRIVLLTIDAEVAAGSLIRQAPQDTPAMARGPTLPEQPARDLNPEPAD